MTARSMTVGRLARSCGLSRTTLLYYDRIGLLRPDGRTRSGYRSYGEEAQRRLQRICELRRGGVPLERIGALLAGAAPLADVLARQIADLDAAIEDLGRQRAVVARMLALPAARDPSPAPAMTRQSWMAMFAAVGLSEADSWRWHAAFEASRPEAHQRFLASLGLGPAEIAAVRRRARQRS